MLQRSCLLVVLALGAATLQVTAQQHTHLSGLVRDPSDAAVHGASVSVVNEDTGFRRTVNSQSDGSYVVASLQPGVYKITVRKEGFLTVIQFGVKLDVAQPARVDFNLRLGSVQDSITVESSPVLLNSDDASVGTLIGREWIEHLPLNGRGLLSLLELAPSTVVTPATRGESGQFSASGQRPNTNYFTVDGVTVNNGVTGGGVAAQVTGGSLPGMTAMGSFHNLLPMEALEEFRVQTATSASEFGRLPGAQVSMSSRSGSNEFHGSIFHYLRNEKLDANDWFSNRAGYNRAALRMNDFGGAIGGPLHKNKTFFFAAYEGMRLRQPFAWRQPAPTREARDNGTPWVQTILNLFPIPDGPSLDENLSEWTGRIARPARLDVGSLRLDHILTSRIAMFARYNETPSSNAFGSTQVNELKMRSRSLTMGGSIRARNNMVVDLRLSWSNAHADSAWRSSDLKGLPNCYIEPVTLFFLRSPGICDLLTRFAIAGVGQVSLGKESLRDQSQWHFLPSTMIHAGSHQIHFGADYRTLAPSRNDRVGSLSVLADSFNDLFLGTNLWIAKSPAVQVDSHLKEVSGFAQDTWRIHPRLTATLGLRWEFTPSPRLDPTVKPGEDAPYYAFPDQTKIWSTRTKNFAPRVALAFRPTSSNNMVIRGGYGLYFDSSLSIATDLVNGGPFTISEYRSPRNGIFSTFLSYGFLPGLILPYTRQWSVSLERTFADRDVFSVAYVGSDGNKLIRRELGGVPESNQSLRLLVATNHGESHYNGLQAQYRRRLTSGWQGHMSYAFGRSTDNSSSDSALHWADDGVSFRNDRALSDFDVRHSFNAALTYETPSRYGKYFGGWNADTILRARSGFPINVQLAEQNIGLSFANYVRPDLDTRVPLWISDPQVPGGKALNPKSFIKPDSPDQGNLGRNAIQGFGMHQIDLALRREFRLGEQRAIQLRAEAFNVFNHPNFADPIRFLSSPLFGQSASMLNLMLGTGSPGSGLTPIFQTGGARNFQLVLRFKF